MSPFRAWATDWRCLAIKPGIRNELAHKINDLNTTITIRFDEQVVIITGAGGGLGREYARLMAARGAKVVVNDFGGKVHGNGDGHGPADKVVAEIQNAGGTAIASYDSVAAPEGGKAIVATALQAFGRVDALVHNAGILRGKSFLKLETADIEDVLDVHLKAAFWLCQPAFAAMKEHGYGRFVLTTSDILNPDKCTIPRTSMDGMKPKYCSPRSTWAISSRQADNEKIFNQYYGELN